MEKIKIWSIISVIMAAMALFTAFVTPTVLIVKKDNKIEILQKAVCEQRQQLIFELFVTRELEKVFDIDSVLGQIEYPLTTPMTEWTDEEYTLIYGNCD